MKKQYQLQSSKNHNPMLSLTICCGILFELLSETSELHNEINWVYVIEYLLYFMLCFYFSRQAKKTNKDKVDMLSNSILFC